MPCLKMPGLVRFSITCACRIPKERHLTELLSLRMALESCSLAVASSQLLPDDHGQQRANSHPSVPKATRAHTLQQHSGLPPLCHLS